MQGAGNWAYEVSLEQEACGSELCCALDTGDSYYDHRYISSVPDATTNMARMLVVPENTGDLEVTVEAINDCTFHPPRMSAAQPLANLRYQTSARGQQTTPVHSMDVSRLNSVVHLYSGARTETGGAIPPVATARFIPYTPDLLRSPIVIPNADDINNLPQDAIDAHAHSLVVRDYLRDELGLNSYDNQGTPMLAVTRWTYPLVPIDYCGTTVPPGSFFNAFWSP